MESFNHKEIKEALYNLFSKQEWVMTVLKEYKIEKGNQTKIPDLYVIGKSAKIAFAIEVQLSYLSKKELIDKLSCYDVAGVMLVTGKNSIYCDRISNSMFYSNLFYVMLNDKKLYKVCIRKTMYGKEKEIIPVDVSVAPKIIKKNIYGYKINYVKFPLATSNVKSSCNYSNTSEFDEYWKWKEYYEKYGVV